MNTPSNYEEIKDKLFKSFDELKDCPIKDPKSYKILNNPSLLNNLINECGKKICNEKEAIKTILLCGSGRLVINSNPSSFNLMVNDESGVGKDFVTRNVLKLLPKEVVVSRGRITPKTFTYWHNPKYEPDWTWDGKICYLEDVNNSILNSDTFKVMCSSGSYSTVVKEQRAIDIEIKGKPVIILTSCYVDPKNELLRRIPIITLDSSREQTRSIMKFISNSENNKKEYDEVLTKSLSYLKRVNVMIPFTELINNFMPDSLIMRTNYPRFLDYIRASASLHQYQREVNSKGEIIAVGIDYDYAREILLNTTSNQFMIPLTKKEKDLINVLKELGGRHSVNDLLLKIPLSYKGLKLKLDKLVEKGLLDVDSEVREDSFKPVFVYCVKDINIQVLPTWKELIKENSSNTTNNTITTNTTNTTNAIKKEAFEVIEANVMELNVENSKNDTSSYDPEVFGGFIE